MRRTAWVAANSMVVGLCIAMAAIACDGSTVTAQTLDPEVRPALATFAADLQAEVDSAGLGGIGAAVMVSGEIVWEDGFGWADLGTRKPAEAHTVFRVGSITKSVTAMTMLVLAQEEHLSLDEPVAKILPEVLNLDGTADQVQFTFRQLASHTAGLEREPDLDGADQGGLADWEGKVLESIPETGFLGEPGAQYSYSNIGYGILGLALSRAVGRPYMDLVRDAVLEPARMHSSGFTPPDDVPTGYGNWDPEAPVDVDLPAQEHEGRGYKVPNGGLYSTAGDLLRFARELTDHARAGILAEQSRREMTTVHSPLRIGEVYGLGVILTPGRVGESTDMLVWHDGAVAGYSAMFMVHPETGTGVAWLRNYNRGPSNMDSITNRVLGSLLRSRGG